MTDKLRHAAEIALNLIEVYSPEYMHGESKKTHINRLRQALAEPPNSTTDVVEDKTYNGWVLRNVYFEDGEPLMHSEPESTQSQELSGKTEKLEAEIKRLQELLEKNNA